MYDTSEPNSSHQHADFAEVHPVANQPSSLSEIIICIIIIIIICSSNRAGVPATSTEILCREEAGLVHDCS